MKGSKAGTPKQPPQGSCAPPAALPQPWLCPRARGDTGTAGDTGLPEGDGLRPFMMRMNVKNAFKCVL